MSQERVFTPEEAEVVDRLSVEWKQTVEELGGILIKSEAAFGKIIEAYRTGAGRAYHNIFHVDRMLSVIKRFIHLCDNPALVKAAVFGHDIVYNPGSDTNERESADMFSEMLRGIEIEDDKIKSVDRLIMVTEKHKTSENDQDGRLLIDSDYEILGSLPEVYAKYSRGGIYVENVVSGKVPLDRFIVGRGGYIDGWLEDIDKNRLFLNPEIGDALHPQAKQNLLEEKEWLKTLAVTS